MEDQILPWYVTLLGVSATITSIGCFFMGIPICLKVRERGDSKGISSFPFVIRLVSIIFWLRYGLMKGKTVMVITSCVGFVFYLGYNIFYFVYTKDKRGLIIQYGLVCIIDCTMLVLVAIYSPTARPTVMFLLGAFTVLIQVIAFGSPLAGVITVIKEHSIETLPLPMIVAYLFVTLQWGLYGLALNDTWMMIANGLGLLLGLFQLSLFLVFPSGNSGRRNENGLSGDYTAAKV